MKTPADALADLARRLERTWSQVVSGAAWGSEIPLGSSGLTGGRLAEVWNEVHPIKSAWVRWMELAGPGVALDWRDATLYGSEQPLPAVLRVADIDTAARLVGDGWPDRLDRARSRVAALAVAFPHDPDPAAVLRITRDFSDVDFDLVQRTARWFADPHPAGLTARQIPIEGLGTKWLAARDSVVRRLAGLETLGLRPGRPPRVQLTYLDSAHLAGGGRQHDVATVGDVDTVAYRPRVVLISENRDTAQLFWPVDGGIALEGQGRGAGAIAALPWVREAAELWYWGDMDADGLEILHGFRAAGLPVRSLFMDMASYRRWERFGVAHDHGGRPIGPRTPRDVGLLTPDERELYDALCSPEWTGHRRIEQERIPLEAAAAAVRSGGASAEIAASQAAWRGAVPVRLDDSPAAREFVELSSIAADLKVAQDALEFAVHAHHAGDERASFLVDFAVVAFFRATTGSKARRTLSDFVELGPRWAGIGERLRHYRNRTVAHSQSDLAVTYPVGWLDPDSLDVLDVSAATVFSPLPWEVMCEFRELVDIVTVEIDRVTAPLRERLMADLQAADDRAARTGRPVAEAVDHFGRDFDPSVTRSRFPSSHPLYWGHERPNSDAAEER